jgi:hypothetical protein
MPGYIMITGRNAYRKEIKIFINTHLAIEIHKSKSAIRGWKGNTRRGIGDVRNFMDI